MIGVLVLVEAIQSVALSHCRGCGCDVCAAAAGDEDALTRILIERADGQLRACPGERNGTAAS